MRTISPAPSDSSGRRRLHAADDDSPRDYRRLAYLLLIESQARRGDLDAAAATIDSLEQLLLEREQFGNAVAASVEAVRRLLGRCNRPSESVI